MELQECRIIQIKAVREGDIFPEGVAITIGPSKKEAEDLGKKELKPYLSGYPVRLSSTDLGPILFPPVPTTVFLYTNKAGRIK